jgi:pyruvate formate lyase activating enzyme
MYDTALQARRRGVRSLVVTGGHINPEPLADLLAVVDAVKVDLKGFTEGFYKAYVRGALKPVLEAIRTVAKSEAWLEIVYLVIPTLNDRPEDIREMARWVGNEAGADIPLHFSRFHPMYLVKNLPPTPLDAGGSLARRPSARDCGCHIGNVPGHEAEHRIAPAAGRRSSSGSI